MAVANDPYIGAWKIVEVISLCGSGCQTSLEGTEMKLDEAGDVTWILPAGGDSDCALFRCETYDLVADHSYNNDRRSLMLAAVEGHAIVFKVDHPTPQDLMVLTCEDWCILQCQRVPCREPPPDHPYSLAALLGSQVDTDVTLTAADGTQMAAHTLVLRQLAPSLEWRSDPLRHLPAAHLRAVVHYLYTESLPAGLSLRVARELEEAVKSVKDLEPLGRLCHRFITNVTLREDLRTLVREMHACCGTVGDQLSTAVRDHQQGTESVYASPAKMAALVRLCLRQLTLGLSKLTLAFDLYGRHEAALESAERREVIRYAQSRLPVFLAQIQRILVGLRTLISSANQTQRAELAARAVSELDWLSTTVSSVLEECKLFLENAIDTMSLADGVVRRDGSLNYVLNNRTLLCVHTLLERLTRANSYILQKREFLLGGAELGGARLISRNTEGLLEELPVLIGRLEDAADLVDQQVNQREFKFYFIATASRVHHIMALLRKHVDVLRPLLDHLQTLVGGAELTGVLAKLGLVDAPEAPPSEDDSTNEMEGSEPAGNEENQEDESVRLSLISAVTRSPLSRESELARRCHQLFKSGLDTDLKFTVRGDSVSLLGPHSGAISERQETVLVAHAPVVAARSAWLRRVLTSGMRESIDKQISICDAPPAIFGSLLEFLYCGHVTPENWPPEQLMELMVLADRYELDDLKHSCEALLESHIDEDSVFCLLSIAEQYNARKLKSSALEFVATNPEVVQTELFLELGPALQAEVEETAVWAPPRPHPEELGGHRLRPSDIAESPEDTTTEELANLTRAIHLRQGSRSSSSSQEESGPASAGAGRLEACLQRLRSIVGEDVSRADLIRVVLAADYDVNRALNFFYSS